MDVNSVLVDILVVLVAAKIAAEIADRINIPAVVAEIFVGVLIGPSVFGFVEPNEVIRTLAELGVILLLLEVGMEMDLRELEIGRARVHRGRDRRGRRADGHRHLRRTRTRVRRQGGGLRRRRAHRDERGHHRSRLR